MTKHIYLTSKDQPITWPKKETFCHVHFPPVGNQALVHIYHYSKKTGWEYLSFYLEDVSSNN